MNTHNMRLYGEFKKIIVKYPPEGDTDKEGIWW